MRLQINSKHQFEKTVKESVLKLSTVLNTRSQRFDGKKSNISLQKQNIAIKLMKLYTYLCSLSQGLGHQPTQRDNIIKIPIKPNCGPFRAGINYFMQYKNAFMGIKDFI